MIQRLLYFAFLFSVSLAVFSQQSNKENKITENGSHNRDKITHQLINSVNNTYGYDIFVNDKLLIHQPSIPGKSGTEGFKTTNAAEKIAELVINKIKKGEMPPTVTIDEMKKLSTIP